MSKSEHLNLTSSATTRDGADGLLAITWPNTIESGALTLFISDCEHNVSSGVFGLPEVRELHALLGRLIESVETAEASLPSYEHPHDYGYYEEN